MHSTTHEISIHRHCMQQLLHDAISCLSNAQDDCQGLLAGCGNMIKKNLAVTGNSLLSPHEGTAFFASASNNDVVSGIYFASYAACSANTERIIDLIDLVQKHHGHPPDCYLLLELSHKGRIDARLFADAELTVAIALHLQEDGSTVTTNE